MAYYVLTNANAINNTGAPFGALVLGLGDNLLVTNTGYIVATGAGATGLYVNGYAESSMVTVDGLITGAGMGIYSLGQYAQITVTGRVIGGSTGVSIANGGGLFVSEGGLVSGSEGASINGATLINNGTVNGTGNQAIQFSGGTIVNNGLISSSFSGIFFSDDATGRITNTGTIQGDLDTWYAAASTTVYLDIDNSGNWHGSLGLTPGDDIVTNTGTISGDVSLGAGNDVLDSRSGLIIGSIYGGAGNDFIRAGAEDDLIDGGAGADTINGRGGDNTVSYQTSTIGVNVNLATGVARYGDAAGDKLSHIQNLTGTLQKDVLVGDNGDNVLTGVLGKDTLTGNGGNDTLIMWGTGTATINGGAGNDLIQLQTADSGLYGFAFGAASRINGGTGYDTVELTNSGSVTFKATTMINVERLVIMDGFDYNLTSHNATVANGKMLEIDAGALGSGHRIQFNGSAETDGRFQFDGGGGNDGFKGGAGADIIAGNGGADRLTGGGGADTFLFNGVSDSLFAAFDAITDFKAGTDKFQLDVDVTGIDAAVSGGVSVAGDLQGLVAGHLSSHHAILVTVTGGSLGGHKLLVVDADGIAGYDAGADYVIDVTGIKGSLGTGDFLV